jgi:hypothetical protein
VARKTKKRSKKKKASSSARPATEKRIQRQIYLYQGLIDSMEKDRKAREKEIRESAGWHGTLSWSANVEMVLTSYLKDKKGKKAAK